MWQLLGSNELFLRICQFFLWCLCSVLICLKFCGLIWIWMFVVFIGSSFRVLCRIWWIWLEFMCSLCWIIWWVMWLIRLIMFCLIRVFCLVMGFRSCVIRCLRFCRCFFSVFLVFCCVFNWLVWKLLCLLVVKFLLQVFWWIVLIFFSVGGLMVFSLIFFIVGGVGVGLVIVGICGVVMVGLLCGLLKFGNDQRLKVVMFLLWISLLGLFLFLLWGIILDYFFVIFVVQYDIVGFGYVLGNGEDFFLCIFYFVDLYWFFGFQVVVQQFGGMFGYVFEDFFVDCFVGVFECQYQYV